MIILRDTKLVNYLRTRLSEQPRWKLEVACHGSNHTDFTTYNLQQTIYQIQDGVRNIEKVLNLENKIRTFIPPFNAFNDVTIQALKYLNFTVISSQIEID